MKEEKMKLPKMTLDEFFTTQEERDNKNREYVRMIPVKEITNFPNHPYKVKDDDEMFSMAETVKQFGVIHPVLVRPKENGGYEMISGHRRKRACEIAGRTEIKAIVREMTDEEATLVMVDSNNQREKILPSEIAFAYKMKMEAIKNQGKIKNERHSAYRKIIAGARRFGLRGRGYKNRTRLLQGLLRLRRGQYAQSVYPSAL